MVRKILNHGLVLCALALVLAAPVRASAYTIYDGNISSTYTAFFRDMLTHRGINDDYLCFRSGQYEYVLLIGDLEYSDGTFTGEKAAEYRISTNSGYNNNSYIYEVSTVRSVNLVPGTALLYSNLGNYPELVDANYYFTFAQLLLIWIVVIMRLIRSFFELSYKRGV